jgi:hypothetical protein
VENLQAPAALMVANDKDAKQDLAGSWKASNQVKVHLYQHGQHCIHTDEHIITA